MIAFGKLSGSYKFRLFQGAPVQFKGQHLLNLVLGVVLIGLTLMDDVPWKPEFDTAVQFLVIGFVVRFVSRLLTAKA